MGGKGGLNMEGVWVRSQKYFISFSEGYDLDAIPRLKINKNEAGIAQISCAGKI